MTSEYHPTDRRPIATRELRVLQRFASWLVRRRVSANHISIFGMLCGIGAGVSLWMTAEFSQWDRMTWIVAAALIQLRLLANLFDGMVAIEAGKASPIGELYNEIPDRVSDSATLIGLGYATGGLPILGFIAAILAMLTAYVRAVGKVAGASQHFCGPMAKQHRMFLVTVVAIFCGIAPTTWQVVSLGATGVGWPTIVLYVIILGALVTAMRRLFRIASELSKGLG